LVIVHGRTAEITLVDRRICCHAHSHPFDTASDVACLIDLSLASVDA